MKTTSELGCFSFRTRLLCSCLIKSFGENIATTPTVFMVMKHINLNVMNTIFHWTFYSLIYKKFKIMGQLNQERRKQDFPGAPIQQPKNQKNKISVTVSSLGSS